MVDYPLSVEFTIIDDKDTRHRLLCAFPADLLQPSWAGGARGRRRDVILRKLTAAVDKVLKDYDSFHKGTPT